MSEIKISVAGPQDAEELLEIYAPYVRDPLNILFLLRRNSDSGSFIRWKNTRI